MRSILRELIYEIEGYGETPKFIVRSFKQNPDNPKRYIFEIEDNREPTPTVERATLGNDKAADFEEGAKDESD